MEGIKNGDRVSIHYSVQLVSGQEIFSTKASDPLEFVVGEGRVIPGLEKAVVGMAVNDKKTVRIESNDAFGAHEEERVVSIDRNQIPENVQLEVGAQLEMQDEHGHVIPVLVTEINDDSVTLDANHPLAGLDLIIDVEVLSVSA